MSLWQHLPVYHRYAELPETFYIRVIPTPLENPRWVTWNAPLAEHFGLTGVPDEIWLQIFSGEPVPDYFQPLAMKYAGHQFGVYNPALGDGRGLLFGEIRDRQGRWFDVHLKGVGQTPYSRMGDGRAVLRSTIREYLCSEAMAALGSETTRALGMMVSDTPVYRERVEQGALLIRLGETHIRFGHFEHFFYTGQHDDLRLLADKVIEWHFPQLLLQSHQQQPYQQKVPPYLGLFQEIVQRTAKMIAFWQAYGFAHGVMNTDNMSVLGQTFDYGPFAFLDDYDPHFICNHSDYQGRYAFDMQPGIGQWNLTALAQAFTPLVGKNELETELGTYTVLLNQEYSRLMRCKLGLQQHQDGDSELCSDMLKLMAKNRVDYTLFFRRLSSLDAQPPEFVAELFHDQPAAMQWLQQYRLRCEREIDSAGHRYSAKQRCQVMRQVNPKFVLRNYLAQQVIDAAEQGDFLPLEQLIQVLQHPYDEQPMFEQYAELPPAWGKCLEISCSS
ncbi:protein adenylyltransferase SelO [Vibrio mangrovi]|uniref:Protein nucleotidyltransferase YdiU n=1 Tax=Vibrio mangrovi TaxID=474394 RepID=A0A1Y6IPH6_9VIBR|nr:YdiU family protein [Vibrio mangrovi]MDW6003639.1 YdiU family protein [Vibrio mangrovi]SMR99569.1 hypothetical protein VIM7927_00795 [Vibrio mangrovi]